MKNTVFLWMVVSLAGSTLMALGPTEPVPTEPALTVTYFYLPG